MPGSRIAKDVERRVQQVHRDHVGKKGLDVFATKDNIGTTTIGSNISIRTDDSFPFLKNGTARYAIVYTILSSNTPLFAVGFETDSPVAPGDVASAATTTQADPANVPFRFDTKKTVNSAQINLHIYTKNAN